MITEYYNFLIDCTNKGFQEHYITGAIIILLVCAVISAIIVQIERIDKGFLMFVTTSATVIVSVVWPIVFLILGAAVLPIAIVAGIIYGLSKLINYIKKLGLNKKDNYYGECCNK